MEEPKRFEQIGQEVEDSQRATVWPDTIRNGSSIDAFLWRGDPNAMPIQRAGLVVFALAFLLLAIVFATIPFQKKFEEGWVIEFCLALLLLLVSMRLIRNAFLRPPRHRNPNGPAR